MPLGIFLVIYDGTVNPHYNDSHVSCHRGVQLILAYSWARPAIPVAGKVERECF